MSSSPCNCRARLRWRAPPKSSAGSRNIALDVPGVVRVPSFAGLSGATRTQASNAAALFPVVRRPEARVKKGLTATSITAELRKRLSSIEGAFVIVIPPPSVPGIGTGGGFTMRIQDRQGADRICWRRRTDELVGAARKEPGLTAVFSPFTVDTPQVFVDIDRINGAETRRAGAEHHRSDRDLFRLGLCQRLQSVRPHLSRHRAGRPAVPQGEPRISRGCGPAYAAGDMVQLGSVVDFTDISGPDRVARYNLYPSSEIQGDTLPGTSSTTALGQHEAAGGATLAERLFL